MLTSAIEGASGTHFLSQGQAQLLPETFLSLACLKQGLTVNYQYNFRDSRTYSAHKDTPSPRLDCCTQEQRFSYFCSCFNPHRS